MNVKLHLTLFFVFFSLFFSVGTVKIQAQEILDPETEAPGTYNAYETNNCSAYFVETGYDEKNSKYVEGAIYKDEATYETRGFTIENSTKPHKFKITLQDQDITAGGGASATIKDIVLDGVIINSDGSIPHQYIETNASTKHSENITFEVLKNSSYITKEIRSSGTTEYKLKLHLRSYSRIIVRGWGGTYYYRAYISYTHTFRGIKKNEELLDAENLGKYKGVVDWALSGAANGKGRISATASVDRGSEDLTYKITIPKFEFSESGADIYVYPIVVDNVKLDKKGNFPVQDVLVKVWGKWGIISKTVDVKSEMSGSIKDGILRIRGKGNHSLLGYSFSIFVDFNGKSPKSKGAATAEDTPPDAVRDLVATVEEGEKNTVTLSFKAPTENQKGEELDSLGGIEIYRGGEQDPVHTLEASMGETYTWQDVNVEFGEYIYRVVAKSVSDDSGEPAYVFVSVTENSVVTSFSPVLEDEKQIEIYSNDRHLVIKGAAEESVLIYSIEGRLIASFKATESERISVEPGVYIVRIGGKTEKLIVR